MANACDSALEQLVRLQRPAMCRHGRYNQGRHKVWQALERLACMLAECISTMHVLLQVRHPLSYCQLLLTQP